MGEVYTDITLKNVSDISLADAGYIKEDDVRNITVNAVVDTGAYDLCLTEEVFKTLGLKVIGNLTAITAPSVKTRVAFSTTSTFFFFLSSLFT